MRRRDRLSSPALLVAVVALVAALGGSALALPGKKTVKENDLANNIVDSKNVKPEAVKGSDIHEDVLKSKHIVDGAVGSEQISDGEVGAKDLAEPEPYENVTDFGDGGQNDCQWYDGTVDAPEINPVSYYKDPFGIVHLAGTARAEDGPGGDMLCDDNADQVAFTLPPGYWPDNAEVQGGIMDQFVAIAPENGLVSGPISVPAGTVVVPFLSSGTNPEVSLDGITFRAIDTTNLLRAGSPARLPGFDRIAAAASG